MLKDRKQRDERRKKLLNELNEAVNKAIVVQPGLFSVTGNTVYVADFSNITSGVLEVSVYATYPYLDNRNSRCLVNKELYGRLAYWGRIEKLLGEKWSFVREARITHSRTIWDRDLLFKVNVDIPPVMYQGLSLNRMFNDYVVDKNTRG